MSNKVFKMPQLSSISQQTEHTVHRKRLTTQKGRSFFKEFPSISRFQNSKDLSQQFSKSSNKRIKTQQIPKCKRQISPSDRQISRFIYKHLHKKIMFQQKLYGDLQSNQNNKSTAQEMDSVDTSQRQSTVGVFGGNNKHKPHLYGYQKTNSLEIKNFEFKKPVTNLKQRMLKNQYARSNMLNVSLAKRRYKKQAHIDAYFDLSCLQNLKQPHDKSFLFTSSQQKY